MEAAQSSPLLLLPVQVFHSLSCHSFLFVLKRACMKFMLCGPSVSFTSTSLFYRKSWFFERRRQLIPLYNPCVFKGMDWLGIMGQEELGSSFQIGMHELYMPFTMGDNLLLTFQLFTLLVHAHSVA